MNGQASPGVEPPGRRRGMPAGTLNGEALGGRPHEWRDSIEHGHNPSQQIYFNDSQNENSVRRSLRSYHILMISISGTFGVGLYVGSGTILRQAGPGGVLLSFSLIGLVSWAVMQCIAEMLCIWPISGALMEFVATFVDKELAITCGVAYWFTYAISMAAIITGTAGESNYFDPGKPLQGVVFFCAMPILMILLNSVSVKAYGLVELISGVLKILFISTIIVIMFAINLGVYNNGNFFAHDSEAAENWGFAFLNSLSIATFAFVGVETTAATALEARLTVPMGGENPSTRSLKNVATRVPILAAVLYFFGSLFVTLNMQWDDRNLPRASWIPLGNDNVVKGTSNSAFVIIATESKIKGLPGVVTVFLLFTGLTAANTQVYIASRTLFSLTRDIEASAWWSCLGYFGRTNDRMIPMRALLASCIFLPIPFAYLSNKAGTTVQDLLDVLSEMGSVSCVLVWACECVAFIRFCRCLEKHHVELKERGLFYDRREKGPAHAYPYRSHGQPVIAYFALFCCLFVLIIASGASLWSKFRVVPFFSAYLAPLIFIALFVFLKLVRGSDWRWNDLSNHEVVIESMNTLFEKCYRESSAEDEPRPNWQNLWGQI